MNPRKTESNPVWQFRAPAESLRQLDELCKHYGMNRTQVVLMLIAKDYGALTATAREAWQEKEGGRTR
jgi:hypothetical protein